MVKTVNLGNGLPPLHFPDDATPQEMQEATDAFMAKQGGDSTAPAPAQPARPVSKTPATAYPATEGMPVDQFAAQNREAARQAVFSSDPNAVGMPVSKLADQSQKQFSNFKYGLRDMLSFGYGDEINAALRGLYPSEKGTYEQRLAEERKNLADSGTAGTVGQIVGALPAGAASEAIGLGRAGLRSSGILGALYGFGSGEGGLKNRVANALFGGTVGAVGGGVLGRLLGPESQTAATRASQDIFDAGTQNFTAAENAGVRFAAPAIDNLRNDMVTAAGPIDWNTRGLRPRTAGFVADITRDLNGDTPLMGVEELRQRISAELRSRSINPDDARVLTNMRDVLDHFTNNAGPNALTGNPQQAMEFLNNARENWFRGYKQQDLEHLGEIADVRAGGDQTKIAQTLRSEAMKTYRRIVKGQDNRWTPAEVGMWRDLARGGDANMYTRVMESFAPRGPKSIITGQIVGSHIPYGNLIVPMLGEAAARSRGAGASETLNQLQQSVGGAMPLTNPGGVVHMLRTHSAAMPVAASTPLVPSQFEGTTLGPEQRKASDKPLTGLLRLMQ